MSAHSQVLYLDPKQFCHDLPRYITRLIRSPKVKVPFHVNNYEAFMDLFIGDVAASKMFRRSVYWWQHSQKCGGWIYKSAKDWRDNG